MIFGLLLGVAVTSGVVPAREGLPLRPTGLSTRGDVSLKTIDFAPWEQSFKTIFDPHIVARNCLASAVYFEARSESLQGQLAVATVILNRAKTSNYPSSICGVVYQGASRLNGCQFSFVCDGKSDLPKEHRSWEKALAVAARALADNQIKIVPTATHYHADSVEPSWSRSMHRLTKIGRHIFYSQG